MQEALMAGGTEELIDDMFENGISPGSFKYFTKKF